MADIDIYLKLDGIPGESTADRHPNEIVVLAYRTALEATHAAGGGGGGGAGKTHFGGIQIRKRLDKASVPLLLACAAGRHIATAQFTFSHAAENPITFYTVTLEDVLISQISQSIAAVDSASTDEEVTLQCARVHWAYRSQNPDGSQAPPITGGWDIRANKIV